MMPIVSGHYGRPLMQTGPRFGKFSDEQKLQLKYVKCSDEEFLEAYQKIDDKASDQSREEKRVIFQALLKRLACTESLDFVRKVEAICEAIPGTGIHDSLFNSLHAAYLRLNAQSQFYTL